MGVPAFFRWLSRKYPSVIVECIEQRVNNCFHDNLKVDVCTSNLCEIRMKIMVYVLF